jgi:sensor histidine kinase regulating citrate/malate metabolism
MTTLSDALRSQAHEFANRLHTIIALIELDRAQDAAELATSELALSQALADRLLSAVEEPVLLALLLGKAAQASERGIAFELDLPDRLEATSVPARDLIAIVGNLIDNALDAASATPSPRVEVSVRAAGDELRIAVADSGPGPRDGDHVFDLGVTTKPAAGHGIGLALVRQAVTRLGGRIHVTGSRFEVTLPIAVAPAAAPAPDIAEATTDG